MPPSHLAWRADENQRALSSPWPPPPPWQRGCWLVLNRRLTRLLDRRLNRIMRCRSRPPSRAPSLRQVGPQGNRLAPASPIRGPEGGRRQRVRLDRPLDLLDLPTVSSRLPGRGAAASPLRATERRLLMHRFSLSAAGQGVPRVAALVAIDVHAASEGLGQGSHCISEWPCRGGLQIDTPLGRESMQLAPGPLVAPCQAVDIR